MANTLFGVPATSGIVSNLEQALIGWSMGLIVGAAFLIVAIDLTIMLAKAYLITGLGVMLLGFGGNRFTASAAEGYFTSVLRTGVRLLFYYGVLAVGMQLVTDWQAALAAACKPVTATVPWVTSYYVPPSSIVTTVCSGSIPAADMFGYAALAAVFAALSVAVPSMAADLVGGTVGLALAHAFEAAYTAQTIARIVNPITASLKRIQEGIGGAASGASRTPEEHSRAAHDTMLAAQRRDLSEAAKRATVVLDPFTGKPDPHPDEPRTQGLPSAPATTPIGNGNGKIRAWEFIPPAATRDLGN